MKKIFKIILIFELIIFCIFFVGYFFYESDFTEQNNQNVCLGENFQNITIDFGESENLTN